MLVDESRRLETLALGPGDRKEIEALARQIADCHGHLPLDHADLLTAVDVEAGRLPSELARTLARFREHGTPGGVLLIKGLPMDDQLPPTPADGAHPGPWTDLALATVAELMVMSRLGSVIAYADEKQGRLVQDIAPVLGAEERQENTGSKLLELHTEDGFHPNKPDFIGLFCVRPDHEGTALTVAGSIRSVLPDLPEETVRLLRRPLFRIRLSSSFTGDGQDRYSSLLPVLTGPEEDPDMCVDFHAMESFDPRATAALATLREHLERSLAGVAMEQGDLLIVDNRVAVHGRTGFRARHDGRDRWLRRCFVVTDIRASRGSRPTASRVHQPL
ncbi:MULTISPECIES: TauD/TfdA family dioxygenase [Kitasatospora]|uniref:L-asparagine oxygenase n=2 Tax=Kitasatospora TaxID=2063 RepID=A0ABT1IT05_9ACTN|nr:TauD/TfdA family dioxygenase [Kitasatospora paracochleata]MCP2308267.1 L-asparagine oxygenase [Kitasatospora paracochleata]